jgi:hypothetical protein
MENMVEWLARETEVLGENLPQCRFVHYRPHILSGREPGPPRWEPATNRLSYGTALFLMLIQVKVPYMCDHMCTSYLRVQLEVPCGRINQWDVCDPSFIIRVEHASENDFSEMFSIRTPANIHAKDIYACYGLNHGEKGKHIYRRYNNCRMRAAVCDSKECNHEVS